MTKAIIKKSTCIILILSSLFLFISCSKSENPEGTLSVTNDAVDFTVYYPEDWTVETNEPQSAVISLVYGEKNLESNKASIRITVLSVKNQFLTGKAYWDSYFEEFKSQFGAISILDEKDIKLDDVEAFKVGFTAEVAGEVFHFVQVIAIRNGNVYTITYTAKDSDFDTSALDTVIQYFEFK